MKIITIILLLLFICFFFLTSCSKTTYEKKAGKVYYNFFHGGNMSNEKILVKDADASSFETITTSTKFSLGKDKNHVFFNDEILENADAKTFENIQSSYYKDKNNVFILQGTNVDARILAADPNTFKILKEFSWTKDQNNVFYGRQKLANANVKTFTAIDENWGKDDKYYYNRENKIDSLDYQSAQIVGANYIKDKNKVFYENILIEDANPKTFKADKYSSAFDDQYIYKFEKNKGPVTKEYQNKHKEIK